ncbi:MAG: hypothetical protein IPP77_02420 [Bacteroidetes bacterium]|nr:hypothetical protein [Bacteroidota bacterium]
MKKILVIITALFAGTLILDSCTGNQVSNQTISEVERPVNKAALSEISYLETGKELALKTKSSLAKI